MSQGPAGPFAHSANARGEWHDLRRHLEAVAALAREFAEPFGGGEWGYLAGLWHDVGKASRAFQAYLREATEGDYHRAEMRGAIDHTTAGAQLAAARIPVLGHLLAFGIVGHHGGLPDTVSDKSCLGTRLQKSVEPWQTYLPWLPEVVTPKLPGFLQEALAHRASEPKAAAFAFAFFVRMLFSCLVDADFLDTERFLDASRAQARPQWPSTILERLERALDQFVRQLPGGSGRVDALRAQVRSSCLEAAAQSPGLFSLTVPTGGGKTLSSLAFSLRHAAIHGLRRVVYVAPFTSIIEQTAEVFRQVVGPLREEGLCDPIIEHHSAMEFEDTNATTRLAAENWDAPIVVTTSVQFYESLYASRVGRCRKLHNLARAVVVLDEAQKLPVELLEPCLYALRELASHYGSTVVLCTATQPAIHKRPDFLIGLEGVREIIREPRALNLALKRVTVEDLGVLAARELAPRLTSDRQVLCIVNTRRHARELYRQVADMADGTLHLSAAMCPQHRSEVLADVRRRLDEGRPCRLIATQVVEAGVDVDFPIVYRALAGIDSIAQAAGRCNRNGRREHGVAYLFRCEDDKSETFLRDTINAATQLLGAPGIPPLYEDLLSLEAIEHYFRLYYWDQHQRWDSRGILGELTISNNRDLPFLFNYRAIAERFRLIEESGLPVFVPWGERGESFCKELERSWCFPPTDLLRRLQRYVVQVPRRQWHAAVGRSITVLHDQCAVLRFPEIYYDPQLGLALGEEQASPESLVL